MKWRMIAGISVGLVLLAVFVYTLGEAVWGERQTQSRALSGEQVVPILARDERRVLLTYGRSCENQKDCEPPLACLHFSPGGESVCVDSSCVTDLQCKQGFACRNRKAPGDGPLVRRCVLMGSRKEGQPCFESTKNLEEACERGLLCGEGYCGRPCQLDVPASCPTGFVCRSGPDGPSCQPFCKGGDCPVGQECVGAGTDKARCMLVRGENCQRQPCPEGLQCNVIGYTPGAEAWTADMECVKSCDEERPCPEDSVCLLGGCQRQCGPDNRDVCGPRQQCVEYVPDRLWLCRTPLD
jgi:hypothetical protein